MRLLDGTTAVLRLVHLDNLALYLARGVLHAPAHTPNDGHSWRATHRGDVQNRRALKRVSSGPGGVLLDYLPFYFGPRSPMLYQLMTNQVPGYTAGQGPLVYLVASAQQIANAGHGFVFYDGHALASLSTCFDDLSALDQVDWTATQARQWTSVDDPDLQRRKQAEFLVHQALPWDLVRGIVVLNAESGARVDALLTAAAPQHRPALAINPEWYY